MSSTLHLIITGEMVCPRKRRPPSLTGFETRGLPLQDLTGIFRELCSLAHVEIEGVISQVIPGIDSDRKQWENVVLFDESDQNIRGAAYDLPTVHSTRSYFVLATFLNRHWSESHGLIIPPTEQPDEYTRVGAAKEPYYLPLF